MPPYNLPMRKIGFIGLGLMGSAMAENLLKAGFEVNVFNRTRAKMKVLTAKGARSCASPAELAALSDAIVVMISDVKAMENVLIGKGGLLKVLKKGKSFINMSTLSREATLRFAKSVQAKGAVFIDAPVSGSKPQVIAGKLVILAGGEARQIKAHEKIFLAMGHQIIHAGAIGQGSALKLCMNLIVAQMGQGLVEAFKLAGVFKLNPRLILQTLQAAPALNAPLFQIKGERLLKKDFSEQFALTHMHKDVKFMLSEAKQRKLKLPATAAIDKVMAKAARAGLGRKDFTVIYKTI